ncbi:polysaccharide deacetylase family protein [Fodinicola feengrottensis]|uniref:polysaccharide deacetylase family protein n=1 Tax=Fodinicola feengrottensis TaxID=435914 RepID=UPI0013D37F4C|nr:polysaccharide deacetylase family protein [Fodinicola feengrottensis]
MSPSPSGSSSDDDGGAVDGSQPPTAQFRGQPASLPGGGKSPLRTVGGKNIALTIDDGPSPTYTPEYLRLLAKLHIKAVFCLIGENVQRYPNLVKQIVAGGHLLCNHTMHHDEHLGTKSTSTIHQDITATTAVIMKASGGVRPVFFRAPGGNWTSRLLAESRKVGLTPLDWSVDPRDWSRPGVAHITTVIKNAKPGSIILCHDGGGNRTQTYAALQKALPALKSRGLTFVTPRPE